MLLLLVVVCCLLPWYTSAQCVLGDLKYSVVWLDADGTEYAMYQETDSGPHPFTHLQATWDDHVHHVFVNQDGLCDSSSCETGVMCLAYNEPCAPQPPFSAFTPFAMDATCNIMTFTPGGGDDPFQWTRYVPPSGTPTPSFSPTVSLTPSTSLTPSASPLPAAVANTNTYIYIGTGAGAAALLCAGGGGVAVYFYMRWRRQAEVEPQYKELAMTTLN